jgi:hypothetical protein
MPSQSQNYVTSDSQSSSIPEYVLLILWDTVPTACTTNADIEKISIIPTEHIYAFLQFNVSQKDNFRQKLLTDISEIDAQCIFCEV